MDPIGPIGPRPDLAPVEPVILSPREREEGRREREERRRRRPAGAPQPAAADGEPPHVDLRA